VRRRHPLAADADWDPVWQPDYLVDALWTDFPVPEGLDPLLTLALGLRAGYPDKPPLPVGAVPGPR
jgi:hypothetical protein